MPRINPEKKCGDCAHHIDRRNHLASETHFASHREGVCTASGARDALIYWRSRYRLFSNSVAKLAHKETTLLENVYHLVTKGSAFCKIFFRDATGSPRHAFRERGSGTEVPLIRRDRRS